jgi:hypothetical protein
LVPLALKIANSQLALPPCSKWSNGVQAYGYDWKLNIQLFDAKGVLAVAGTHPKYLGCYLHMLSIGRISDKNHNF